MMVILHEDKDILPFGLCKKWRKHGSLSSLKLQSNINIADLDLKKLSIIRKPLQKIAK